MANNIDPKLKALIAAHVAAKAKVGGIASPTYTKDVAALVAAQDNLLAYHMGVSVEELPNPFLGRTGKAMAESSIDRCQCDQEDCSCHGECGKVATKKVNIKDSTGKVTDTRNFCSRCNLIGDPKEHRGPMDESLIKEDYDFTTEAEVQDAFWQGWPEGSHVAGRSHNSYNATIRSEFSEFIDMLQKNGHISPELADTVTLDESKTINEDAHDDVMKFENAKWDREIVTAYTLVKTTGKMKSNWWRDAMEGSGHAFFGGPRPEIGQRFNCFHLTPEGEAHLSSVLQAQNVMESTHRLVKSILSGNVLGAKSLFQRVMSAKMSEALVPQYRQVAKTVFEEAEEDGDMWNHYGEDTVPDHAIVPHNGTGSVYDLPLCPGSGRDGLVKYAGQRASGDSIHGAECPVCHHLPILGTGARVAFIREAAEAYWDEQGEDYDQPVCPICGKGKDDKHHEDGCPESTQKHSLEPDGLREAAKRPVKDASKCIRCKMPAGGSRRCSACDADVARLYANLKPSTKLREAVGGRSVSEIAREIYQLWRPVNYAAAPYLDAMTSLNKVTDKYMMDSGESVVLYFLSNATSWKGDDARRIKAELKALLKAR